MAHSLQVYVLRRDSGRQLSVTLIPIKMFSHGLRYSPATVLVNLMNFQQFESEYHDRHTGHFRQVRSFESDRPADRVVLELSGFQPPGPFQMMW